MGLTKRVVDVVLAVVLLVLVAPTMLVIALAVRMSMGAPVLFRQTRPGWHGRPFTILKFRTMATGHGDDRARITPLGRWLRATSLDELPELLNVLRGEMSLVGPRPLLIEYLRLYSPLQARRHEVRPGITGWAQVSGRNTISHEERFDLDVWYVDHRSLVLDLRILGRTVRQVLTRQGITEEGHVTKERFSGT